MRTSIFLLILILDLIVTGVKAQSNMADFLPGELSYSKDIPDPQTYFGHLPGDRHLSHDQIVAYARELDRLSDRLVIEEYARSHENRPLLYLIFTSMENHQNLAQLKEKHAQFSDPNQNITVEDVPLVILLGYGVHGNESSAPNAAVMTMYYLAAAEGPSIDSLLNQTIILVDPSLNPDGLTRHSTWVNMHQGKADVSDPASRGFTEAWPGGRTNHYWFDLNRDYLFVVHPESQGRIRKFHEWKPNIVNDHHEMGANSTFFFQPGIFSRINPLVPLRNHELTARIAAFHSQKFDERGELYYTEESFDDFYLGKGSSYPDVNGSVGILYEQAGYRGKVRETAHGTKTLSDAVKNQFDLSLSTLEAGMKLRRDLLESQKAFFGESLEMAKNDPVKGYIIGDNHDLQKLVSFAEILATHRIQFYALTRKTTINQYDYQPGQAIVIPMGQPQYRLIKGLMETNTRFADSTFYDVSTWTVPLAFGLNHAEIRNVRELSEIMSAKPSEAIMTSGTLSGPKDSYAWLMSWNDYHAPAALWQIQQAGIRTLVATRRFKAGQESVMKEYPYGTILIPAAGQKLNSSELYAVLEKVTEKWAVNIQGVATGMTSSGIDLGSNYFIPLKKPEILMVIGESTSSREAGEIWHLLDQRYEIQVTLADISSLDRIDLHRYTTLILPGGNLRPINQRGIQKMKDWVSEGGILLALGDANQWVADQEFAGLTFKNPVRPDTSLQVLYAEREEAATIHSISGVILKAEMDISHPLGYGYQQIELPVFKSGIRVANTPSGQFTAPVRFAKNPLLSGYISKKNLERLEGAPVVTSIANGRGRVISIFEPMNFRGTWVAGNKIVANALFFGPVIR